MSANNNNDKKLYLLDAYALIFRAYFAMSKNPLINSKGLNTSAISGFLNTLVEILQKHNPTHIAIAFDAPEQTDRQAEHSFYKANRQETPEDLIVAVPWIKEIVKAFRIPILEVPGYEADDIIGTLAKQAEQAGYNVYMVTPDKDFGQLVSDKIFIYRPPFMGNPYQLLGEQEIKEKWEISDIKQVIDILGLWGDSVDNIPGIPGVGEKTAKQLIKDFGSIENLLANTDQLKGKLKERVEEHKEQALISKKLATILLNAPVAFHEEDFQHDPPDKERLKELFAELEFRTIGKRILGEDFTINQEHGKGTTSKGQMDLFGGGDAAVAEKKTEGRNIENTPHTYRIAQSEEEITTLIRLLSGTTMFCFDTETTGLNANNCDLVGMSFSIKVQEAWYVPVPAVRQEAEALVNRFKPLLENPAIAKIGQNLKYDMLVLRWYGVEVQGELLDTMLMHYILEPDSRHNMNILAENYLGYTPVSIEELIGKKGTKQGNMQEVPLENIAEYAGEDADITFQLYEKLSDTLKKEAQEQLYRSVEAPLINVLTEMEFEGVRIDPDFLRTYAKELEGDILSFRKKIHDIAGLTFNVDSPKQLGEVLFDYMKIPYPDKKTKTGQYSTGEEVLSKIEKEQPIAAHILDYRELTKLKSTYVDALPLLINPRTGRLHTTFNQAVAATGRLSSTNPNLQNIPIRTDRGQRIRRAFIPRDEKHTLFSADYSQVELRIVASISEDPNMVEFFHQNLDIHAATAAKVYGVELEAVTSEMRRNAKMVNFGIIYGISAFGLSQRLGIPRGEAAELIRQYFEQFSGVKRYMDEAIASARNLGYAETLLGRRRYLRDINSGNMTIRGYAERNAINAPIQGSAADMIKVAMINIHAIMQKEKMRSKMILQVHDELLFDVYEGEMDALKPMVEREMQNALPLKVPVEVGMGIGNNWLEAH
jgi:DNA polymerase I